ncbi:MAG: ATP-binding cassette domain-containing protein, partial [Parvimonas sp.]|nr:ATP-binding cassette domain-containing protein [Parvimonas sp.]
FLFNENIVSNITLFKNFEDNLIYDILNKVNLDKKLIENRNENLNELNLSISGGEKQKIIIARALLRNSNFLVFDEAMSNIDKNSISIIEKMILSDENLGFINISHNYSEENVKMYDYILEFTGEEINIIKNR